MLIVNIISVFGLVNILTQSILFAPFRDNLENKFLKDLFQCPMCLAFWCGLLLGYFIGPYEGAMFLFNGFFYSATTWILHCIVQFLGAGNYPTRINSVSFYDELKVSKKED
jgi:hypothetical protein